MKVRMRYFGALAERLATTEEMVALEGAATVADALRLIHDRYADAAPALARCSIAVNHEMVDPGHRLQDDDEVALLPPVSGGAPRVTVGLVDRPSVEAALDAVASPDAGGTVVFVGTVRREGGAVERLAYSAYEEMAERVLREIGERAAERWGLAGVAILHGVGDLEVGQATFVAACAAAHRDEAFAACRHVVDEVKHRVPIWKKEIGPAGERWVGLGA